MSLLLKSLLKEHESGNGGIRTCDQEFVTDVIVLFRFSSSDDTIPFR